MLLLLAELEKLDRAVALLEEALQESTSRPALQASIQCRLAWAARFTEGFDVAFEHARRSLELAEEVGDDALRVPALVMMAFLGSAVGDPQASSYADRAHEIAIANGSPPLVQRARLALPDFLVERATDGAATARCSRACTRSPASVTN